MPDPTSKPPPADPSSETRTTSATPDRKGSKRSTFSLLVSSEAGVAKHDLSAPRVLIGRGADCDVPVNDSSISRHHARLEVGESITLEDLGSTNGTRIQGRRIERGDRSDVSLGVVFELGSATFVLQKAHGLEPAKQALPTPTSATIAPPAAAGGAGPVVCDPTMRHLYALLDVIAPSPLNVLVLGETGVGKEVFAEEIHRRSDRRGQKLLRLNCAALPQSTLEGELFGYERGAFTGAVQAKPGLFESADGGTVFLDEIGDMPMETQAKLLRVLESGEVLRLGALSPRRVDVRFIAATNRDLRQRIIEMAFRPDLYFRLNGTSLTLPPLRKRKADIEPLARHALASIAERSKRPVSTLTDAAISALERYGWPGNVRELRNVLERTFVMTRSSVIDVGDLALAEPEGFGADRQSPEATTEIAIPIPSVPVSARPRADPDATQPHPSLRIEVRELEKERIVDALNRTGGNQTAAAKVLGISRHTLMSRMEDYGIARPRKGHE